MVQEVLRDGMDDTMRQQWLERAVEALNQVFPSGDFETWQHCKRLVTHVQTIECHFTQLTHPAVSSGRLLNAAGYYLHDQGRYSEAEPLSLRSLSIREQQLGEQHPDVASSLNNLVGLYQSQGRYAEAEPLYLRALAILFDRLGKTHPNTQTVWRNFLYFLQQVIQAGQTTQLSDHPWTQALLRQIEEQSGE
ncbi:MAG: tetratricopeptide repeat protein [Cyanobacteria bacterium CRU_2_1]|nr:tetratricopeptide repeat protein [Cyanobacteria bacterium CRU_2_1]